MGLFYCQIAGVATPEIIRSLAPKSVTTPIAMEVSKPRDILSLTAAVLPAVVGLFGAAFGFKVRRVSCGES